MLLSFTVFYFYYQARLQRSVNICLNLQTKIVETFVASIRKRKCVVTRMVSLSDLMLDTMTYLTTASLEGIAHSCEH